MEKERRKPKLFKSYLRNIAIMVAIALMIGTVSVSANVSDNLGSSIDKILGPVNASLNGSFNTSSTNGKLNQMKKDMDATKTTVSDLLAPYLSNLTVWVDSTNASYRGKTVSATNSKGEKETASFVLKNGHFEATFSKLVRNTYKIGYPFILSNGKQLDLAVQFELSVGNNTRQLFGDLQKMSMDDIQAACKAGVIQSVAKVGDTISDGTYTYTIIGINQDKPSDADGNLLDTNSYGDVLTLMALGAPAGTGDGTPVTMDGTKTPWGTTGTRMNQSNTTSGSWKASEMRKITMASYLAKLPVNTQKMIGYVQKITGTNSGITSEGGANITTGDKCFLLSGKEIFGGIGGSSGSSFTTTEAKATFQYQYFTNIAKTTESRNFIDTSSKWWWLRSPYWGGGQYFCSVGGGADTITNANDNNSVFPAFCIY